MDRPWLLRRHGARAARLALELNERLGIVGRHHLHEARQACVPILQQVSRTGAAGVQQVALDQDPKTLDVEAERIAHAAIRDALRTLTRRAGVVGTLRKVQLLEPNHRLVAARFELAVDVVDIGDATRHAGGEVAAGEAEYGDNAARHVFAAMIAGTFDHRDDTGIAHREALAGHALEIGFAGDGAIKHGVADDDVLGRLAFRRLRLSDHDATAGKSFADIVVAVARKLQTDAARQEGAEALAGRAFEANDDRVLRQSGMSVPACHFARQHRADRAVDIPDLALQTNRLAALDGRCSRLDQVMIELRVQIVVLRLAMM